MDTTQRTEAKKTYKYFAFISYSSDDRRWAKKLQRNLEQYRLPARLQKRYPEAPKRAYPVFRDDTHLAGFKVWASLTEELDDSQYLILLCSPNSAASEWVNKEVQYFIDQGKEDKILPLIIDGEPYANDPAKECFPPALLRLQDPSRGIRVRSQGWRKAYLNMISTLLGVDYDELLMRDQTRRTQTGILRGAAGAAALAAAITVFWAFTEFTSYYNAYTLRNEAPVGIYKMSPKERAHASEYYRFTKYRGDVIRVECVNSYGTVIEPVMTNAFTDYPILEFDYNNHQVTAVVQKDATGKVIARKEIQHNPDTNEMAIDFHSPSNNLDSLSLSSDMSAYTVGDRNTDSKSEIIRLRNTYDNEGRLILSLYQKDNRGTPACDSNGVYGKAYEYNDLGLIRQVYNLDENGQVVNSKYGWASERYTYNEMGDPICSEMFDAAGNRTRGLFGYYINYVFYDSYGNPIRWEARDGKDRLMCTEKGYAVQQIEFNDAGLYYSAKYLDDREQPVCSTEFYHELRFDFDDRGRATAQHLFGTDGQPVYSPTLGFSSTVQTLDENGRLLEQHYLDTQGNPSYCHQIGAWGLRCTYDENGNPLTLTSLDENWEPTVRKDGFVTEYHHRNADGQLIRCEFLDAEGNLVRCGSNYAVVVMRYDNSGNPTDISLLDEQEAPCLSTSGYATTKLSYENGNLVSARYFGINDDPVLIEGGYHESRMAYDESGNCIRLSFHDAEGNLCCSEDSFAVQEHRYDRYGNVTEIFYLDANGEPLLLQSINIYKVRFCYDQSGRQTRMEYLDANGNLAENTSGYAAVEFVYDNRGHKIRESYLDKTGKLTLRDGDYASLTYAYDAMGNPIEGHTFNKRGEPCLHTSGYSGIKATYKDGRIVSKRFFDTNGEPIMVHGDYFEYRMEYDEKGNCIRRAYYDTQGNLFSDEHSYAIEEMSYDLYGNMITQSFYDAKGELAYHLKFHRLAWEYDRQGNQIRQLKYSVDSEDESIVVEREYDASGNHVACRYFDRSGNPVILDGEYHEFRMEYDDAGHCIRITYYDTEGNLFCPENSYAILEQTYDESGNVLTQTYYDATGNLAWNRNPYQVAYVYDSQNNKIHETRYSVYEDDDSVLLQREYNALGQIISSRFFDREGNPILLEGDYHLCRMEYDDAGNCIRWSYYDTQDKLFCTDETYAILEQSFDSNGNILAKTYYDAQGEYAYHRTYYRIEYTYDDQGHMTKETIFGSNGLILLYVYTYDDSGNQISEEHFMQEPSGKITKLK